MKTALLLAVIAWPAFATSLDGKKLERLLGLEHHVGEVPPVELSPLPWRLLGTLRGSEGVSFAAVDCASRSVTLQVGDVRDGVEVVSIEQQVLIVRRQGRLEQVGARPAAPTPLRPAGRTLSRQVVDRLLGDPATLLQEVQVFPAMVAGKLSGFRARFVKEGSVFATLGLKAGDVITKVNGTPLDDMQKVLSLLQVLMTTRHFEVELERGGRRFVESVDLER